MAHHVKREMTISYNEFFRLIPIALSGFDYQINSQEIRVSISSGELKIKLGQEYQRKIASLALPVIDVEFIFEAVAEEDSAQFLERFSRTYQRGGG